MYLEANDLYGWAVSIFTYSGFRWLTKKEINNIDLAKYKGDSKKGVILEADLEYPQDNNNKTNDPILNLTPENITQHSWIV